MADLKHLVLTTNEATLTITINREASLNSLSMETLDEIKEVMQSVIDDKDIKGVILTGAGDRAFAAGADIKEFEQLTNMNARKFAEAGQEVMTLIENSHTPVIAVVNGFALGGGCELALACHMRIATESALFGQPEVSLGIVPGYGGTQRMTQLLGKGRAFEFLMTGDRFTARQALSFGMVNYVTVSKEDGIAKANDILNKIYANAPIATGLVVDCVNGFYNSDENGYQTEANAFARCCGTDDFQEGYSAFVEKRAPEYKGE